MAMLISETDARAVDLKSSVYELLGRDLTKLNTLEKLVKCHYLCTFEIVAPVLQTWSAV